MGTVVAETAYAAKLLCLPVFSGMNVSEEETRMEENAGKQRSGISPKKIRVLHEDGTEECLDTPADIRTLSAHDSILIPGALTEANGRALLRNKALQAGATIVVRDSSCLLLKRELWEALSEQGVRFAVQKPTRLAAVTVNPVAPEGWRFDPYVFLDKVRASVPVPVLDILRDGKDRI